MSMDTIVRQRHEVNTNENNTKQVMKALSILETCRSLQSEHEATLCFSVSMLANRPIVLSSSTDNNRGQSDFIPGGVLDAWLALSENTRKRQTTTAASNVSKNIESSDSLMEYAIPRGQYAKATANFALASSLQHASQIAKKIQKQQKDDGTDCFDTLYGIYETSNADKNNTMMINNQGSRETPDWFLTAFYERVKKIRDYDARHGPRTESVFPQLMMQVRDDDPLLSADTNSNFYSAPWSNSADASLKPFSKQLRAGNPSADGYDLHSLLTSKFITGQQFSTEEIMGKYLDLQHVHELVLSCPTLQSIFELRPNEDSNLTQTTNTNKTTYPEFCMTLAAGLSVSLDEQKKLLNRKKYMRWIHTLFIYISNFLERTSPLLDIDIEVVKKAVLNFEKEWSVHGGINGWKCKSCERSVAFTSVPMEYWDYDQSLKDQLLENYQNPVGSKNIELKDYETIDDLMKNKTDDELKLELSRLNMKCGGKPLDRAKRLWESRDMPLDKLPSKLFIKKRNGSKPVSCKNSIQNSTYARFKETNSSDANGSKSINLFTVGQRRIDIARVEFIVTALLDQLRPILDATIRRAERRLTQTRNEREREMEQELLGDTESTLTGNKIEDDKNDDDEGGESSEEEGPIYNPKGVPLGWDGKPIPYWLFKLHGLNHFFLCEICGNESYRGRRNFEKHFTESKHSYGMRCLGIPNTKHFHGVTKIEDAKVLWKKLQANVSKDLFDASKEEEYEDSHGNVLSRATYEDLARQGLL